jgi:hypothetical protein
MFCFISQRIKTCPGESERTLVLTKSGPRYPWRPNRPTDQRTSCPASWPVGREKVAVLDGFPLRHLYSWNRSRCFMVRPYRTID